MTGSALITREFTDEVGFGGFAEDCAQAGDEAIRLVIL